jgi:hypothetical protein
MGAERFGVAVASGLSKGANSWKNVAENSFVARSNRTRNSAASNASQSGRLLEWPRIRMPTSLI